LAGSDLQVAVCHRYGDHRDTLVWAEVLWFMSDKTGYRCAIYTRKSTEEGLDQDFNSLDAQREACAAYVTAQGSLGWKLLSQHYDDGGISGGHMDRPAIAAFCLDH
jgi:hypothetical protein